MKKVLLIIPAYNEEKNIVNVAKKVEAFARKSEERDYKLDYVVINDGSTDNTLQQCRQNGINVISLSVNLGIGGAVQTGYKYALMQEYDVAVQFDGDGQHDLESLDDLLQPIFSGQADFVVGSRFVGKKSAFQSTAMRRFGIRFLSIVLKLCAGGLTVLDCTSGYRAACKDVIALLASDYPVDYPEPESLMHLFKRGFTIKEVSANMFEREGGQSSIRAWKSVHYMIKVTLAILIAAFQMRHIKGDK